MIVDTGIVTLGRRRCGPSRRRRLALGRGPGGAPVPWDLYRDWLPLLAREPRGPRRGAPGGPWRDVPRASRPGVAVPPEGLFVHLGTTRDFHDAVVGNTPLRRLFPFTSQRESAVESGAEVSGAFAGRSLLSRLTRLGRGAVVDHCRAAGVLDVGADGVASGVQVPHGETLRVDAGRLVLPDPPGGCRRRGRPGRGGGRRGAAGDRRPRPRRQPQAGAAGRRAGRRGDPQRAAPGGLAGGAGPGPGRPLAAVSGAGRGRAGEGCTLWEARLFVADGDDPYRRILTWLQRPPLTPERPRRATGGAGAVRGARALVGGPERFSLRDLLERLGRGGAGAWRGALMGDVAAARVVGDVGTGGGDESFSDLFSGLPAGPAGGGQAPPGTRWPPSPALTPDPLHRARYWRLLADLASEGGPDEACLDRAAGAVREAVSRPPGGGPGWRGLSRRPGGGAGAAAACGRLAG